MEQIPLIPVNSIEVPDWIVALCADWYYGSDDMLYAVCSTGGLTLGNRWPIGCDSEYDWYYSIWEAFSADIGYARRAAKKIGHDDTDDLEKAEEWVDAICEELRASYLLED